MSDGDGDEDVYYKVEKVGKVFNCTLCTAYCVLRTVYSVQCTMYCVLCPVYLTVCTRIQYRVSKKVKVSRYSYL